MIDTQLCLNYSDNVTKIQREIVFTPGLHVIYGESGSGKTDLIKQISNHTNDHYKSNRQLDFSIKSVPRPLQIILQNPDDQIVGDTVKNEILFSIECQTTDAKVLQNQYSDAANKITYIENFKRHPATLSGGEKELLNIVTSTMLPMKCILIDDALSFLSVSVKKNVANYLMGFADDHDCTILWFSSDYGDLKYGITKSEIKLSFIKQIDYQHLKNDKKLNTAAGSASLIIKNLSFQYAAGPEIFSGFNVNIENFRALGIKGSNGCGKTTLVQLIQSIEKNITGSINIFNNTRTGDEPRIGYLDQFPERMLGATTLADFFQELVDRGLISDEEIAECYNEFHGHKIDWESIKDSLPIDLPWSILRQTLIIILTFCNYDLLILDEPTFGFGRKQKLNLALYLQGILNKKCLIVVSHDDEFIESICDQVITLDEKNINIAKDLNSGKKK